MKPHMNLRWGVWACFTFFPRAIGCGRTPAEAYTEWTLRVRRVLFISAAQDEQA